LLQPSLGEAGLANGYQVGSIELLIMTSLSQAIQTGGCSMYHRVVANKVRSTFDQVSRGKWEPMLAGMAPRFSYRFYGEHALSGERHTLDCLRRWWERSVELFPQPTFAVQEVIVAGSPWATRIATRVRIGTTLVDGPSYENVFM
jgi:ketosteroid isomerase-like protein